MQTASCFIRLLNSNGPSKHEAFKSPVTPAEVVILRAIHGDDAVVRIKPMSMDKREHRAEIERLRIEYGPKVVEHAFPGHSPSLPVSFRDIGIDLGDDEDDEPQPVQRRSADSNSDGKVTVEGLKAALTALGVQIPKGASKKVLEKLHADAVAALGNGDPNDAPPAGDGNYDPAIDGE